jgi:hypothetical protein
MAGYLATAPLAPDAGSGATHPFFQHGITVYLSSRQGTMLDVCQVSGVVAGMAGALFLHKWFASRSEG